MGYDTPQVIEEAHVINQSKTYEVTAEKISDVLEKPLQRAVESGSSPQLLGKVCCVFCLIHLKTVLL